LSECQQIVAGRQGQLCIGVETRRDRQQIRVGVARRTGWIWTRINRRSLSRAVEGIVDLENRLEAAGSDALAGCVGAAAVARVCNVTVFGENREKVKNWTSLSLVNEPAKENCPAAPDAAKIRFKKMIDADVWKPRIIPEIPRDDVACYTSLQARMSMKFLFHFKFKT
jgi:hypothetical protein